MRREKKAITVKELRKMLEKECCGNCVHSDSIQEDYNPYTTPTGRLHYQHYISCNCHTRRVIGIEARYMRKTEDGRKCPDFKARPNLALALMDFYNIGEGK